LVNCRPLGETSLPLQLLGLLLCWLLSTLSVLSQVVVRVGSLLWLLRKWLLILLIVLLLIPTLIGLSTIVLPLILREWLPVILLPLIVLPLISTSAVIVSPTLMLMLILVAVVPLIAVAMPVMTGCILIFSSGLVVVSLLAFAGVGPLLAAPLVLLRLLLVAPSVVGLPIVALLLEA